MLVFAIILFLVAAVFGAKLLTGVLKNYRRSRVIMLMHGTFALFGLLIAVTYMISQESISPYLLTGVILIILAAMGGLTMLVYELKRKPIPKAIALIHPLVAICGVVTLVFYLLQV